jgi:hypothetical protein
VLKVILETEFQEVSVCRPDSESTDEAVEACYDAVLALGHSAINVAAGFRNLGNDQLDCLDL